MPITSTDQSAIDHFRKGREIFHLAWFEEAPSHLNKAVQLDSTLAIAYIYLAMTEYFQYQDPLPFVEKAKFYGKNASPGERWLINGWEKFINTNYLETVDLMDSLLSEYPNDNYAKHILGFSYRDAGKPDQAVEVLSKITDRTNPFGAAYNHLAFSYFDLGETEKALTTVDQFIAWAPYNPSAYDTKGHMLYDMGEYEKAIPYFFKGALLESRFAYCQRFLADAFMMIKEFLLARRSYIKAIDMADTYGEAFKLSIQKLIGLTYMAEDDLIKAESVMNEVMDSADALSMDQYKLNVLESIIKYALATENMEKASDYLNRYSKKIKNEPGSKKYAFFNAWRMILEDSYPIASSLDSLDGQEKSFLEALTLERKGDLKAALSKYHEIEQPDLYIKSRIRDILLKDGQIEASKEMAQDILKWKGYPNLDYALAVRTEKP